MKIYIAGFFNTRERLLEYRDELKGLGHEIVSSWLNERPKPGQMPEAAFFKHTAIKDLTELQSSECMIVDTFDVTPRGGREVELGFAMSDPNRLIYVVGPRRNIFHHLADETFGTWSAVIDHFKWNHTAPKAEKIEEIDGRPRETL